MSKKNQQTELPSDLVKVIVPVIEEGYYAFEEFEISKELLNKHGKLIYKSNPDIVAITQNQIISKAMDIYGL